MSNQPSHPPLSRIAQIELTLRLDDYVKNKGQGMFDVDHAMDIYTQTVGKIQSMGDDFDPGEAIKKDGLNLIMIEASTVANDVMLADPAKIARRTAYFVERLDAAKVFPYANEIIGMCLANDIAACAGKRIDWSGMDPQDLKDAKLNPGDLEQMILANFVELNQGKTTIIEAAVENFPEATLAHTKDSPAPQM